MEVQGRSCSIKERYGDEVVARVKEELLKAASGGRIACARARQLAADLGVEPELVGALCNELRIKITDCALGCF